MKQLNYIDQMLEEPRFSILQKYSKINSFFKKKNLTKFWTKKIKKFKENKKGDVTFGYK